MAAQPGQTLSHYRLIEKIGEGVNVVLDRTAELQRRMGR